MKKINERNIVLDIINKVEANHGYVNILLSNYLKNTELDIKERNLITELVYGVIRHKNTLDWYLENLCKLKKSDILILNILRIGAYQIIYLDKIPSYAAVSESVDLAKKYRGATVGRFVNGVLRNLERKYKSMQFPDKKSDSVKYFSLVYSHPEWLVKLFIEKYNNEIAEQIFQADNVPAPVSIWINKLRISTEKLKKSLSDKGIEIKESAFVSDSFILELNSKTSLLEMDEYKNGWFQIQDESSALVGKIVNPLPGELVLDLCAAPGGKTVHLAALMNNKGKIIAGDINSARLKLISDNSKRLGVNIIEFNEGDARKVFPEKFSGKANHVLVDAPCSGLGILRRKLDARWNKKIEDIKALPSLQYELLESGYKCLIKGGTLVYSTCTIIPEENEDIIIKFLKNHPDMQLENLKDFIPGEINKFVTQEGWIKILPSPSNSLDGFFIAKLRNNN